MSRTLELEVKSFPVEFLRLFHSGFLSNVSISLMLNSFSLSLLCFGSYQHYFGIGLLVVAGIQVIKSSTRSLIVPLVVSISGAIISHTLEKGQTLFTYDASFYQWVMIAGIIGIAMSVVTID